MTMLPIPPAPAVVEVAADGTWALPPGDGPCRTWPLDPMCGCLPVPEVDPDQPEPPDAADNVNPQQRSAIETASEILWRLTGGVYGLCQDLIRPCRRPCTPPAAGQRGPVPMLIDGQWVNILCRCTTPGDRCGCGGVDELTLPGPVHYEPGGPYGIDVWIDGVQLTLSQYRYIGGNRLVRTDGQQWPLCQDTPKPITEPGTWGIRYWHGTPVPPGGRRAAAIFACELVKACNNDDDCQLPIGVTEVIRNNVTFRVVNKMEFLDKGRTGLYEVDLWRQSVNPKGHTSQPQVYSVDLPGFLIDPTNPAGLSPDALARPGTIHAW